jgi:hypothetical protein
VVEFSQKSKTIYRQGFKACQQPHKLPILLSSRKF